MVVPKERDDGDHDWLEMTELGQKWLHQLATDAALEAGLRISGRTTILMPNHEKGQTSIGYAYTTPK